MIESLIIALREGIEIALVIGILIVYLRDVGRSSLLSSVYAGLILAVAASIGGAVVLQKLSIDSEALEGFFMAAAAIFVISMIVWMWFTAKHIRADIQSKVGTYLAASSWRARTGILLFTFLMVVREGIETAVFLEAVALSAGGWRSIAGTALGVGLATVFAVLFIRGSLRIDIGRFLKVTAVTLVIFALQLIVNSIHEFFEYGILPASPKMMGLLGPIVQNDALFILAILSIPAVMLLIPGRSARSADQVSGHRRWQLSAAIASLSVVVFLGVGELFSSNVAVDLTARPIAADPDSVVRIPTAAVSDGAIHHYTFDDHGLQIGFFVLRTSVGKIATAFDACRACYSYGRYYLKKGELICSQCDAPVALDKLHAVTDTTVDENNSGSMEGNGCAPIFLPSRMRGGNIEITSSDLRSQRKYFIPEQSNN